MSNTATGKFYSHSTCKFTDDAVEKIKGSWYIKLGFAGFNSRANNLWGYQSKRSAESVILHHQNKGK